MGAVADTADVVAAAVARCRSPAARRRWRPRWLPARRARLPLECTVNLQLLLRGARQLVQLDATYHARAEMRAVDALLARLRPGGVVARKDARGNVVVALTPAGADARPPQLPPDADAEGAWRALALDADFYAGVEPLRGVLAHPRPLRVSIDVVSARTGRAGALLAKMTTPEGHAATAAATTRRFHALCAHVAALDPALHLALNVYAMPAGWDPRAERAPRRLTRLPPTPPTPPSPT